jgi:hypothetical protein
MTQKIKIGTKLRALRNLYYFMGQIESDKISKGEICVVDKVLPDGRIFVEGHADRYGPWSLDDFQSILNFTIKTHDIRIETEFNRDNEPKKKFDKIYIWIAKETIIENLINRRNRPYTNYKKEVIPQLMKRLKKESPKVYENLKDVKWGWNKNCGCTMCPCSPGFVGNVRKDYPNNVYTIHVDVKITN